MPPDDDMGRGVAPCPEIAGLFGPGAVAFRSVGRSDPELLYPEEQALIARAMDKRRAEFAAGRACARAALARLGAPAGPLLRAAGGGPDWPAGFSGSLSHCEGFCAAVVLPDGGASAGLDIERRRRVRGALSGHILSAAEAGEPEDGGLDPEEALTLRFSAKEAFYKAQHPLTGVFIDFPEVSVLIGAGSFRVRLERPVPRLGDAGQEFAGRYLLTDEHVITAVTLLR